MAQTASPISTDQIVTIRYTNHRGQTAERRIVPREILFGSTEWHPGPQWLLEALDVDKGLDRTFCLADVASWRPGQ